MFFSKDMTMGQMNALAQLFGDDHDVLDALRGKFKVERIAPRFVISISAAVPLKTLAKKNKILDSGVIFGEYDRKDIETGTWECELLNDPLASSTDSFDSLRDLSEDEEGGWEAAKPEHLLAFAGAYPKIVKDLSAKIIIALGRSVSDSYFLTVSFYEQVDHGPKRVQAMTFDYNHGCGPNWYTLRVRRMK